MIVNRNGLFAVRREDVRQLDRFIRYALAAIKSQDAALDPQDTRAFYRIARSIEEALQSPIPVVKLRSDTGEVGTFLRVLQAGQRLSKLSEFRKYEGDRLVMQDICKKIRDRCIFSGSIILNPEPTLKTAELTVSGQNLTLQPSSKNNHSYVAKPNPLAYWFARLFGEVIKYPSGLPMYYRAFRKLYPSRFARL